VGAPPATPSHQNTHGPVSLSNLLHAIIPSPGVNATLQYFINEIYMYLQIGTCAHTYSPFITPLHTKYTKERQTYTCSILATTPHPHHPHPQHHTIVSKASVIIPILNFFTWIKRFRLWVIFTISRVISSVLVCYELRNWVWNWGYHTVRWEGSKKNIIDG